MERIPWYSYGVSLAVESHSVTCHQTQVNTPCLNSHACWYLIYLLQRDGRLSWPSWLDSTPAGSWTSDLSDTKPLYHQDNPRHLAYKHNCRQLWNYIHHRHHYYFLKPFLCCRQVLKGLSYLREKHSIMHRGLCFLTYLFICLFNS